MMARRERSPSAGGDEVQRTVNVLMAGVGGQGVLVASEVLALTALGGGMQVKQSEVHGVAQRGGSVVSHVRFGRQVFSPLIRCGEADFLYAGERLEALRHAHYVKPGGLLVVNDHAIQPIQLTEEPQPYPEGIEEFLRGKGYETILVPALSTAVELGDKRCANVVLLGALATRLPLEDGSWRAALEERLPDRILDLNLRAFAAGRRLALQTQEAR